MPRKRAAAFHAVFCAALPALAMAQADDAGKPAGLLDITDVLGLLPAEEAEAMSQVA